MNRNLKIFIGVIVLGVGGYFAYKKFTTPTKEQFDRLVQTSKDNGSDLFSGATTQMLEKWFKGFQSLTKKEAEFMIEMAEKKEKNWSATEKMEFERIWKMLVKKLKALFPKDFSRNAV
jgi:hypothetical protein